MNHGEKLGQGRGWQWHPRHCEHHADLDGSLVAPDLESLPAFSVLSLQSVELWVKVLGG